MHVHTCFYDSDDFPICEILDDGAVKCGGDNAKHLSQSMVSNILDGVDFRQRATPIKAEIIERLINIKVTPIPTKISREIRKHILYLF